MPAPDYQLSNARVVLAENRSIQDGISEFDITQLIVELNIFESIYAPYLSGSIIIADTNALSSLINFQGQELFLFDLKVGAEEYTKMRFVIYKTAKQNKSINDASSVLELHIIEEHAYLSYFKQVRTAYSGNISKIIQRVLENELNQVAEILDEPLQSMKVLGVNRSPLALCQWLTERATTEYGEPFFLYSTMKDGLKFQSLGNMLNLENKPIDGIFRYSQIPYSSLEGKEEDKSFKINHLLIENNDDMISIARKGAIKGTFFNIDPYTGTIEHGEFKADEHFNGKNSGEGTSPRTLYPNSLFDENFQVGEETMADLPSVYASQINTTSMFEGSKSFGEDNIEMQVLKLARSSDMTIMNKQRYEIIIDGYHMMAHETQSSIGTIIEVKVPKDQPAVASSNEDKAIDKKRSGYFLITNIRHRFDINGEHKASVSIARLGSPDNINDPNRQEEAPD